MSRIPKVLQKDGVTIVAFGQEFENIENADTQAIGGILAAVLKETDSMIEIKLNCKVRPWVGHSWWVGHSCPTTMTDGQECPSY